MPIRHWVLHEACRQCRLWQAAGLQARIAVDLCAAQFYQPDLIETIETALAQYELPAQLLELEMTETVIMAHAQTSITILERLSRMGVTLTVDEFGTGYSSMSYLCRFPIDQLKIDSGFVQRMADDPQSARIVTAIVSLAHSLNVSVTAEGVETEAQFTPLRALQCDHCQGSLFGRPTPAAQTEAVLRARLRETAGDATYAEPKSASRPLPAASSLQLGSPGHTRPCEISNAARGEWSKQHEHCTRRNSEQ